MYDFGDGYKAIAPSRETLPMDPGSERAIVSTPIDSRREVALQVLKNKDGTIWGIVDNSLIFVDWPQGKKIRFSMCRVFDVYAGEA